ncbi:MAG: IS21 family transposase [Nitrosomonadales bacterium]|nr:IS21 family transposase [Nitrosomonadales bacterium]
MIDYETFCKIRDHHDRQGLTVAQTARALGLHPETVAKWVKLTRYEARVSVPRTSRLDAFKDQVVRLLESHPYSAQQIFQRLQEAGYGGGLTIVKDYVAKVRPARREAFLKLAFAPGECAQVDWGEYGSVNIGSTRRRLSFFVLVLAHSRRLYVQFTVSQTLEHFLACHEQAFAAIQGVPSRLMVDNLKSAVLQRLAGCAPVFNARYLDFSRHWGFDISACAPGRGNEKGRVENAVGYVKKNFLAGLQLSEFSAINPAAQIWLDTVANVRIHGETRRRPIDLFQEEQPRLRPLNPMPYDIGRIETARAGKQFRVTLDTNHYSVPARYVGVRVTLKAYPDRICIYHQDQLIARHTRCYDRHQDIEDPDHPKALIAQRANAREQRLWLRFLSLSPKAQAYYDGLEQRRANARHHLRKIVALADIYGTEAVARAIEDALVFHAFSCEYIANLLEMRSRERHTASPLHLTRRQDLLEIEIEPPDLSPYERDDHES